jgi:hypothetical protein
MSVEELKQLHLKIIAQRRYSKCIDCGKNISVWKTAWLQERCRKCFGKSKRMYRNTPEPLFSPHMGRVDLTIMLGIPENWMDPARVLMIPTKESKYKWIY